MRIVPYDYLIKQMWAMRLFGLNLFAEQRMTSQTQNDSNDIVV